MKTLNILWQRLVTSEGETCERCGGTQEAIAQVIPKLREALILRAALLAASASLSPANDPGAAPSVRIFRCCGDA